MAWVAFVQQARSQAAAGPSSPWGNALQRAARRAKHGQAVGGTSSWPPAPHLRMFMGATLSQVLVLGL